MHHALGLSLLLHLLILALPLEIGGGGSREFDIAGRRQHRDFAPLNVALAPRALLPAENLPTEKITLPPPGRLAASLDTAGADAGEPEIGNSGPEIASANDSTEPVHSPGLPVQHYFPRQELSRPPRVARDIDPYLGQLKERPGIGKAVMVLWISERGEVDRVETEKSDMDGEFEAALQAQFRAARFLPGERDGIPVKSLMRIEVEILPRSRFSRSAAAGSSPSP
ncbi:MAG: hypothetical protein AB1642_03325 [Pseudomonadota bacterium]